MRFYTRVKKEVEAGKNGHIHLGSVKDRGCVVDTDKKRKVNGS